MIDRLDDPAVTPRGRYSKSGVVADVQQAALADVLVLVFLLLSREACDHRYQF